ncbi:hypothetical protein BJY04DRAFT_200018 [Aspergillus karnatakaensis]|uniref:uncharacterized protein n=1 Tax=Aspergillus karnatakaensis TaxID=1810916 RepID=UPI003CCD3FE0
MACPITVTKFIGTISLGLLTGLSYSASTITVPSLTLLSTSTNASKSLNEVKRLNRKHGLRLANISNICLLFAYSISPRHRKHPYLVWMVVMSAVGSYGVDYWFHRQNGVKAWFCSILQDTGYSCLGAKKSQKKEDDLVVVETEENVNGEVVRKKLEKERRLQGVKAIFSGLALSMGIVGLWGDRRS